MNYQTWQRPPYGPRIHFDEAGAGGAAGAGPAGGAGDAGAAGGGGGAKPWFDGIDGETIGHWDNKGWKKDDPKALATELTKAWKGLEKHFGVPADQLIKLPKDTTDEAGWKAVHQRLGAPAEAKDYDFSTVKFADGSELDQGFVDPLRAVFHKSGVPKEAASEIVKSVVKFMDGADATETTARQAAAQQGRADLQKEWGQNFEFNRLTAMQGAKRAAGTDEGGAKLVDSMEQAIGYKATMEFFRKIGAGTSEDTFVDSSSSGNPTTMNGAKARLAELRSDPDFSRRYLSGDKKAVDEMNNLIRLTVGA